MKQKQFFQRLCSTFLLSMICLLAFSQGKQIQGVVKDATGEPIIGANVLVKGTTNGMITDIDGNFSLSNVNSQDVIVFSYIGYITQEVTVGDQTTFNIILKEDTETLDEVVVVGYGTMKKSDLTGSISSVSSERIASIGTTSRIPILSVLCKEHLPVWISRPILHVRVQASVFRFAGKTH